MKKRVFALFIAFIMILCMLPTQVFAASTELSWSGGTITLASGTKVGSVELKTLDIYKQGAYTNYPEIASVTQDGNTINITLAEGTDPSYPLQMGFSPANSVALTHSGNTCTLQNGEGTASVTVSFRPAPNAPVFSNTFTVNFTVIKGETYAVTPPTGEGFTFEGSLDASKDKDYSFNIVVNEGYDGTNMVVMVNGKEISASDGKYTVPSVSEDLVITVEGIVKKEVLTITKPAGDGFTVTGADTVYKNEDYTFTISVDNAFDATGMVVKANETVLVGNNGKYTVPAVSENIAITVDGVVAKTVYTVTLTAGEGYTISGQATSYANEPYTFTVSVDDSMYWADKIEVLVDGEKVTLTNGKYTFGALDSNKVITVENVIERQILAVNKPEIEGVTINGDETVREGKPYTFTVTVDEKYDGTNMVVTVNGSEITVADNKYTVDITTEDITIEITGIVKKDICEIIKPADGKFTFTGEDFAYNGNDYVFTVTPNPGYIAIVKVNGVTVEGSGNTYTVKAEGDEITILVTTEKAPIPEKELGITAETNTYTVDVTDNALKPFSSYHATVTGIKISGAQVSSAFESGTEVYFILSSDTPDEAELIVEFIYTNKSCTLKGNTLNITLKDGEAGVSHTVTADYRDGWKIKPATYTLVFFRELPAEEPPVCIKNSDTKEVWKDRSLEIDLSEYFTDADNFYLANGEDKTPIEGKIYTFTSSIAGERTLVFVAENEAGEAVERLTVTVNVKDIESGVYVGHTTGNGSWNYIQFFDTEGNLIEGIEVSYDTEGRVVSVLLPKTYAADGTIKAKLDMTQNESGYPFVSTSTETTGNRAFNSRFTEKNIALTGGSATFTFYYYNRSTSATNNGGQTRFAISIKIKNDAPILADGIGSSTNATITAGENYTLDLSPIFTDVDEDDLIYKVSINGASSVAADASYTFTTGVAGTYTLLFTANDGKDDSTATYTVILTVENSIATNSMTVYVPEGVLPQFYVSTGFAEGIDQLGVLLDAVQGVTADRMTAYTVIYPINAEMLSVRAEGFGGMAFSAQKDGSVTLRKVQLQVVDYDNKSAQSTNVVSYGENTVVAGSEGWLVVAGGEYIFTATPSNTDLAKVTQSQMINEGADTFVLSMMLGINNPMSITVPTGAKAQLYKYNQYYSNTEYEAKIIKDNGDGTTTYQFVADTKSGTGYIYRVSMEGKITKAGWLDWGEQNLTVTYSESDKSPSYRLDDYSATGEEHSAITEDSVLLNANSRGQLQMSVGDSITLKAYRAWEIIPVSYNNYIIIPDFHYTVILGNDVVSLTKKDSPSAGDGDWMTLTALKKGIAIIEVTYDAIEISGGSYDGVYGASDPNRTGLLVIQVGENNDVSVKFGIDSFASIGISGDKNITYNPSNAKEWDAEFDTLYFLGESGVITMKPSASGSVTEVAVSHDKGLTWTEIVGKNGIYAAEIVPGNNIIRVKTDAGVAYQIVRGDRITVKLTEVDGKSDGDGVIETGETIRVTLIGLHNPIPKMAGNYNPGYGGNLDGYSSQHINYTCNGIAVYSKGAQYNFTTTANYIEIVMPTDGSPVVLSDGYIGLGVIGLTNFVNGGDSHRNIPDGGSGTRGSQTTFHTRSILPEITVYVGDTSAPNIAPVVRADAPADGSIYDDQKFAINPDTLFVDPDGNPMSFTVSVNGSAAVEAPLDYKFIPSEPGTYTLVFTATDGKESVQHTITVTVNEHPKEEDSKDNFGLDPSEIAGYITISFEDNGIRVNGETGLKFPIPLGTIIPPTAVPYKEGENIAQVTKRLLDSLGITMGYSGTLESGFYLGEIRGFEVDGTPYDAMGEFDAGVGSGWMITQNGIFINMGASEFTVQNGDVIEWKFTCQLGADIGDTFLVEVNNVIKLINAIGVVDLTKIDEIEAAKTAYEALNADQKAKVTNYAVLTEAIEAYEIVKQKAENDQAAADSVIEMIDAIGTVTNNSGTAISSARSAYDALTEDQKALVTNANALIKAELDYAELVKTAADVEAARTVEGKINAIGTVSLDSKTVIEDARKAYEALTATQKALVGNLSVLEAAESKLLQLQKALELENSFDKTADYLEKLAREYGLTVNSVGGEWIVIGLSRADRSSLDYEAYYNAVVQFVKENINEKGQLHKAKVTENARVILALTALGYDVTNVGGYNLLLGLNDMTFVQKQGVNGPIWTLIALDSHNYDIPVSGDTTREKLISTIIAKQLADGGWTLSGTVADVDMTAMALTALAPYYNSNTEVKEAIDKALLLLSQLQQNDGGFASVDGACSESAAQVIIALTSLGIDPHTDTRFIKNSRSVVDALCDYFVEGGGFKHISSLEIDEMATEQGYCALVAYFRLLEQKTSIYNMNDVEIRNGTPTIPDTSDEDAARSVESLIQAIGPVTLDSEERIHAARIAYDALTVEQKALVKNYDILSSAEAELIALKDNGSSTDPDTEHDTESDAESDAEQNPESDTQSGTNNNDTTDKKGCGAVIGGASAGAIALIFVGAVLLLKKKKLK